MSRSAAQITEAIVHHSESPPPERHADCPGAVRGFQEFHMGPARNWSDIGYNRIVCPHGEVYEGRPLYVVGAHAPGHNISGIGYCIIDNGDGPSTFSARRALRDQLAADTAEVGGLSAGVRCHRDVYETDCPGDGIAEWVHAGMSLPDSPAPPGPPQGETMLGLAIVNVNSLLAWDLPGHPDDPPNGTRVAQSPIDAGFDQLWTFEPVVGEWHAIKHQRSGKVLDWPAEHLDTNSTQVQLFDWLGGDNQLWTPVPTGANIAKFVSKVRRAGSDERFCLDIAGSSRNIDAPLTVFPDNGSTAQAFCAAQVVARPF